MERLSHWRPGPVVQAVFVAGLVCVWAVFSLVVFYDVDLQPVDVAVNSTVFIFLAAWWTERMSRR